ncbi:hypothetical protein RFI_02977 [Reticulomyxa filosa]|uniref:Pentatricopeptide repeat-containing protein n=1 Tax=Reticulomyxa filosa TaxID=46433 RepID=X6P7D5_RETFI|nr:hypothetical protein RFI_02977 [Reticulomyxa filosa]|eukprot:ETO34116.1 hypothetical protein RFI_02977 [Reticulomyxa filosa]
MLLATVGRGLYKSGICRDRCFRLRFLSSSPLPLSLLSRQLYQTNARQPIEHFRKSKEKDVTISVTSKHEKRICAMENVEDIIKYLKMNSFEDISTYFIAINKCSKLKHPNAIDQIIQIVHDKDLPLDVIFCTTVLKYLGMLDRFNLQRDYFEQWFNKNENGLIPDYITFHTIINVYLKKNKLKQALYYFYKMIDDYNIIKPAVSICTNLLSICGRYRDLKNAELIWKKIKHDCDIKIDRILYNSMLNVYAKCGDTIKMMKLLNESDDINEITCTIIISGFLKANKIEEIFNFFDKKIPNLLAKKHPINLKDKKLMILKSIAHLKMLELLNDDQIQLLQFHHQQFLSIFENKLYPNISFKLTSVSTTDMNNLIESYVLLNKKSWMKSIGDIEKILFQESNYLHSFHYWTTDITNPSQLLLDLRFMSIKTSIFFLRYAMTCQRDKFKNGPVQVFCNKYNVANKIFEQELTKWKIPIRLENDRRNQSILCLNQEDVSLFFQTVPPRHDCLK